MNTNYIDELNESQCAAVTYNDGPSLVIAGAGSGKTRVLTYKIAYLLEQENGYNPWNILALTFTNKAAREMKERVAQTLGRKEARFINTDKAPAYGRALALLKREGRCPSDVEHRQIKYRNNVIECDHGKLKRIIGATLGFKSMKTAYATIKGIEVMRALRKGQASAFYYGDPLGEMRLVSRVFEM